MSIRWPSDVIWCERAIKDREWMNEQGRVAGKMVAHSSSDRVIACLNLSQVPYLLMCVGKWLAALLAAKRSACVAPEVDLRECMLHLPPQKSE